MFIRYSKYGKNIYCQVAESFRDENGKPKHRIVMALGKVDDNSIPLDEKRLLALAEQINIACGKLKKEDAIYAQSKHKIKKCTGND